MLHKISILTACVLAVLLLNLTACKKSNNGPSIFGTWNYDSRSGNYIYRMSYKFYGDSTLLFTNTVLDTTRKELGYRYKMTGRYRFNGSALSLFQSNVWSLQNAPNVLYASEQNLIPLLTIAAEQKLTVNFSADKTSFVLIYPPCGPSENCLGSSGPYIKQ